MGGRVQLDIIIEVDGSLTVGEGHAIAHRAEDEMLP